jgi:putative oxidoreductase
LQKLEGRFDGPGIDGTKEMMESLEMRPATAHAYAAGVTETAGGALLAAGAATPLAAASLIGVMITAIRKVHLKNGPWISNQGYEYNLVLIAALLAIVDGGPGPISVDALRRKSRRGFPAMLGALGLGAAASTIAIELGRRTTERQIDIASYESERDSQPGEQNQPGQQAQQAQQAQAAADQIVPAPVPTDAPRPKKTASPSTPPATT